LVLALAQAGASQNSDKVRLVGVGTTTSLAIYSKWFQAFDKARPDLHFSYIPSGSEEGIEMVTSGAADFGSTDAPLGDKQLAKAKVLQFATLLGAIVPIYNVPGVAQQLRFSPHALAGIYLGTISRWNDPAISAANPEIQLPSSKIAVVHGASGRGSTYIWSDYLSKVSVEWRTRIGRGISIQWPVGSEGDGYASIARMVRDTPNSIGYVEFVYAVQNQIPYGQVQNASGKFIRPDFSSLTAAATAPVKLSPSDFRVSITDPSGDRSYPISSFTWILVPEKTRSRKQEAMKDFLRWVLNEGQTYAEPAGFAKLPAAIVEQELKAIEALP
jgi:phosphate transport system substrate-binding protein